MACLPAMSTSGFVHQRDDGAAFIHVISNPSCAECSQVPPFHITFTFDGPNGLREAVVPGPKTSYGSIFVPADPDEKLLDHLVQWDEQ